MQASCTRGMGAFVCLMVAGCDSGSATVSDAGLVADAGAPDSGVMRRPDAGPMEVDAGPDPVDAGPRHRCDPFFDGTCAEGEKCSMVIDYGPTPADDDTVMVFDCVPAGRTRSRG